MGEKKYIDAIFMLTMSLLVGGFNLFEKEKVKSDHFPRVGG